MTEPTGQDPFAEHTLVMPFVICQSEGGPYEDEAFVAGFTCGTLDAELRALAQLAATPAARWVRPAHLPQVDLIAMHHGYTSTAGEADPASGWHLVTFEQPES